MGADAPDECGRDEVGQRVDHQRQWRAEDAHQGPSQRGADHLRAGRGRFQPAVGLDELVPRDQGRDIGEIGDVEEDREGLDQKGDRHQKLDPQHPERGSQRDRGEQDRPCDVRGDHHRPSPQAIDPRPGKQAEEQMRQTGRRRQHAEGHRRCAETQGSQQRQRHRRELRSNGRRRLRGPKPCKVAVTGNTEGAVDPLSKRDRLGCSRG